tara:strand:- start:45 stop:242 length:198 start_codon:yes stop_codon:yes gene_type:complete
MASGPRNGKMKPSPKAKTLAGLREIRPGVLVNDNYKPGKDPALDAVIKKDPTKIKSSGMGDRWKV